MNKCIDFDKEFINISELFDKNGFVSKNKNYVKKIIHNNNNVYKGTKTYDYYQDAIDEIIKHFKKKGNDNKVSKAFESRYTYKFDALCVIIDTLTNMNLKHKVWFRPLEDFDEGYEINFEELLVN